ncbi:hypothetical protein MLD38_000569 [Melastoma candidum]|uniref:Uncharacterized protein n=1 Tax=Melastoma candidum TaxID=119954 RepID=A0ACB9SDU3_9MYRT|nr:hypothetical protein MLD38_000569 [Melastoma candidum]
MSKVVKEGVRVNNNHKKAGVGSRGSREDGGAPRERARSLRKVQRVGLRGLVDDGKESVTLDKRRKRVYSGRTQVLGDRTNKKFIDGKEKTRSGEDLDANSSSGRLVRRVGKVQVSGVERKYMAKKWQGETADEMEPRGFKEKSDARKKFTHTMKEKIGQSSSLFRKKQAGRKRELNEELESRDDEPRTRKRVIRIDPHDISNKRMDDGIVVPGIGDIEVKKDTPEKNACLSKNAQFRAIQPSPSILSFVEDNLLGRRRMIDMRRAGYNTDFSAPLDNTPFSTSSERERIEENVFRNKLSFYAAAKVSSSFPTPDLPEVAFAGRSNVGKSSLLNALTRQWGVARTSDKPGLTQTINFFKLGTKLCLVDLPGYGFAYAKDEDKDSWEELVKEYVCTRMGLKRVCLLVDTKWGLKPRDHELIDLMERHQTRYQIVLTKTDLVFPIDVARRAMQVEESLKGNRSAVQPLMMVSSKSGAGIRCLRTALTRVARFVKI